MAKTASPHDHGSRGDHRVVRHDDAAEPDEDPSHWRLGTPVKKAQTPTSPIATRTAPRPTRTRIMPTPSVR